VSDRLLKFLFHGAPVRGELVQLDAAWQRMIQFHDYPAPVIALLGEMTAALALLAANIKFNGALTLQVHGDGPVRLMVVECQPDFRLRATAKIDPDAEIAADATLRALVNRHGQGRCAITLDPRDRLPGQQPYQGVVSLEGDSIAAALESYMRQSEQLDTRMWLAANGEVAAGLLLQRLPQEGGVAGGAPVDDDAWPRAQMLAATVTPAELLTVGIDTLMQRLFWQEKLQHAPPATPQFVCNCSRERIGRVLLSMGRDEVDSIVAERGEVEITCDFCNARQVFDAVDVAQLFATGSSDPAAAPLRPH
jgi:molecular chaperone Hsp33